MALYRLNPKFTSPVVDAVQLKSSIKVYADSPSLPSVRASKGDYLVTNLLNGVQLVMSEREFNSYYEPFPGEAPAKEPLSPKQGKPKRKPLTAAEMDSMEEFFSDIEPIVAYRDSNGRWARKVPKKAPKKG